MQPLSDSFALTALPPRASRRFRLLMVPCLIAVPGLLWGDAVTQVSGTAAIYPWIDPMRPEASCSAAGTNFASCTTALGGTASAKFGWGTEGPKLELHSSGIEPLGAFGGYADASFSDWIEVQARVSGVVEFYWTFSEAGPVTAVAHTITGESPCSSNAPGWANLCSSFAFTPMVPFQISAALNGRMNFDSSMYRDATSYLALGDILVTDTAGRVIPASISGDYPLDPMNVAPEPGSLALLAGCVLLIRAAGARKQSRR